MGALRTFVMMVWITGCLPPPPMQPVPPPQPPPAVVIQATPPPVQPTDPYAGPSATPATPPPPPYAYTPPPPPPPAPTPYVYVAHPSHVHDGEIIANFAVVGALAATDVLVRQDITNGDIDTLVFIAGIAGGGGVGYLLTQKYPVDDGAAHATTIGTTIGIANGALLIEPLGYDRASSVMGLMFAGSAVGAIGGFIYGENAHLTSGQATFVGNMTLLGSATAALTAIAANRDGHYGGFEDGTLAIGLDGGAVAGALIAPHLDWSPRRAKYVFASTFVGSLVGALIGGLVTKPSSGSATDGNAEVTAAAMAAGMWGGLGLGILMTKDSAPDPMFAAPASQASPPVSMMPMVGDHGQLGMMTGGTF